jgi:hypothetical protein
VSALTTIRRGWGMQERLALATVAMRQKKKVIFISSDYFLKQR